MDKPLKILMCHNYYQGRGGEEQVLINEKELLEAHGHKVILFTRDSKEISGYNFVQKARFFINTVFSFDTCRDIKGIIEKERPDIVHIHNVFPLISPSIYWKVKKYGIPVVQTAHNYRIFCLNGLFLTNKKEVCERCKNGNFIHGIFRKCYRNSYCYSIAMGVTLYFHAKIKTFTDKIDIFISPSEFLKKKLLQGGIPAAKIVVKQHFIKSAEIEISHDHGDYAVYMGRLSKEKGLLTLLEAFKDMPSLNLKILGEGQYKEELQRFAEKSKMKNVEFLGFIEGKAKYEILKKAMFLVFPSEWYENMPCAILESLACGVPVIASRIGGVKELIRDGETGLFFEPGNPGELKQKISYLVDNEPLLHDMRRNAYNISRERYSCEMDYENIRGIYNRLRRTGNDHED